MGVRTQKETEFILGNYKKESFFGRDKEEKMNFE